MIILGVGDIGVTNKPGEVLKTLGLGSCVAVVILDPKTKTVGMVHVALPQFTHDSGKITQRPGYFADTGIPALINKMTVSGCSGNGTGMIVKLAGGSKIMDPHNTFDIGRRNVLAIKRILWAKSMGAVAEDVGGTISRSVTVYQDTGRVVISSPGRDNWEL